MSNENTIECLERLQEENDELRAEVKRVRCIAVDLWVYIGTTADIDLDITAKQMDWFVCPVCLVGSITEGECDNGGNPCTEGDD